MLTRCPHCTASFRVSDAQLQAAHGKVRCGACMKVFNASEHLLTDEAANVSTEPDDLFMGLDHDDDFADLTKTSTSASEDITENQQQQKSTNKSKPPLAHTSDDEQDDFSESFKHLDRQEDGDYQPFNSESGSEPGQQTNQDASRRNHSIEPNEKLLQNNNPLKSAAKSISTASNSSSIGSTGQSDTDSYAEADRLSGESDDQFSSLRADPVSVKPTLMVDHSGDWLKKAVWAAAIIGLLAVVGLQIAWLQFDSLARHSQLRPLYSKACDIFGCKLPSLYDISQIRSQNLVVRSHPLVNKALIIDAIIINQADFQQPFPDITLTFSDINNNIIARRAFTPAEYLSGEAKNMPGMPANIPVHIALEILDPGKEAVNYVMGFVENKEFQETE